MKANAKMIIRNHQMWTKAYVLAVGKSHTHWTLCTNEWLLRKCGCMEKIPTYEPFERYRFEVLESPRHCTVFNETVR